MSIRSFLYLVLSILGLFSVTQVSAQGTTGNTITFDSNNCTALQAGNASTWNSYLRHNQAPFQLVCANPPQNSRTAVAPLQGDSQGKPTGTGLFSNNSFANNMIFSNGKVEVYNNVVNNGRRYGTCFSIIAPKGYRITEYYFDIENTGSSNATIRRYSYQEGSTYQFNTSGESLQVNKGAKGIMDNQLSGSNNILYFWILFDSNTAQGSLRLNTLQIKYVIEESFDATLPNAAGENKVSTGILNLGEFQPANNGTYYFVKENVTDYEDVNIVAESGSPQMSVTDGIINVEGNNTYYIESPAKYRIVGATLNFQMAHGSTQTIYETTTTLESGGKYKISSGNGNYLGIANNGTGVANTDESAATVWTITKTGSGYTIYSERQKRYLAINVNLINQATLTTTEASFNNWDYNSTDRKFTYTNSYLFDNYTRGIRYNNGSWSAANNSTPLTFHKETITSVGGNESYTATVYKADGKLIQEPGTANLSTSNPEQTITVNEMNNDALKFSVAGGHAGFTVDLKLEPLDPTLQTLEIGYLSNGAVTNAVPVSASDYNFGNIVIPILTLDQGKQNQIVFRNAYNEKGTNCFLVDSEYEQNSFENQSHNKVDADKAGTVEVKFSNIDKLTSGQATVYKEYEFQKSQAGYQEIKLRSTDAAKTIYIYSGDRPLYCIMTDAGKNVNNHVAYTFYKATVKTEDTKEVPEVALTQLLTETYKGDNNKVSSYNSAMSTSVSVAKDSKLDTTHKFYGVKVTSKVESGSGSASGYLTIEAIVKAIEDKMKEQGNAVYTGDYLRTILYVDMSELKSVAASTTTGEYSLQHLMLGTADNCLFFMPIGYKNVANNIVEGGEGGRSTGDVVLYDQQPFYSPYNFSTGTRMANYTRNVVPVDGHENVTTVTLVLPFTINLSEDGHLKNSSDNVVEDVTFYQLSDEITKNKSNDKIYDVVLTPVTTGKALAGVPYIVQSANGAADGKLFEISSMGIGYAKTDDLPLTGTDGSFTSHGTFSGTVIRDQKIFYFSKDYFWNSKTLTDNYVNVRPFRGWYTTTDAGINALAKFGLVLDMGDNSTTGISNVETTKSNIVYDLQGRVVSRAGVSALPKGLYIMNGKKVIKK